MSCSFGGLYGPSYNGNVVPNRILGILILLMCIGMGVWLIVQPVKDQELHRVIAQFSWTQFFRPWRYLVPMGILFPGFVLAAVPQVVSLRTLLRIIGVTLILLSALFLAWNSGFLLAVAFHKSDDWGSRFVDGWMMAVNIILLVFGFAKMVSTFKRIFNEPLRYSEEARSKGREAKTG